ncbi:hypothetical protein D6833_09310 [Candidatus Parcubacteria bacterium]|nr:MAG: hypothetical protein D6833_09310 [Candidatus Parcubacteria bacterium]
MSFADWRAWLFCLAATVGDVGMILFIFALGCWIFGGWEWAARLTVTRVVCLLSMGALLAIGAEMVGVGLGYWHYSARMPTLPWLNVGLVPFMQMLLLPVLAYRIGWRLTAYFHKSVQGGEP